MAHAKRLCLLACFFALTAGAAPLWRHADEASLVAGVTRQRLAPPRLDGSFVLVLKVTKPTIAQGRHRELWAQALEAIHAIKVARHDLSPRLVAVVSLGGSRDEVTQALAFSRLPDALVYHELAPARKDPLAGAQEGFYFVTEKGDVVWSSKRMRQDALVEAICALPTCDAFFGLETPYGVFADIRNKLKEDAPTQLAYDALVAIARGQGPDAPDARRFKDALDRTLAARLQRFAAQDDLHRLADIESLCRMWPGARGEAVVQTCEKRFARLAPRAKLAEALREIEALVGTVPDGAEEARVLRAQAVALAQRLAALKAECRESLAKKFYGELESMLKTYDKSLKTRASSR